MNLIINCLKLRINPRDSPGTLENLSEVAVHGPLSEVEQNQLVS